MMEIAVYGLPVRMPHWSFGVRYIYQLIQRHMGNSRLFEVVFPGNPGHAYLAASNGIAENILVTAHVLGHADFSRNNLLFRRCQEQVSEHIVEHAANHARQIQHAIEQYGKERVETVLDAALALEQHIDVDQQLRREKYPDYIEVKPLVDDDFRKRFAALDPAAASKVGEVRKRAPVPLHPERDLLWFIANYAPDLESWERDIFLAVREESFYFYPVFATQIMNEGWASYWHARLLREADFVPQQAYLDAIKCHSDVVRPIAADQQVALSVNPYHLGFSLWEKVIEQQGLEAARRIMEQDDDFGFVRNYLTRELAEELGLFRYNARSDGQIKVLEHELPALHESLLHQKYNFGAPSVAAKHVRVDGTLELFHDHVTDGRGLDLERSRKVLEYVHRVWRRPVILSTVDSQGSGLEVKTS
jgi:stage V sporulation protein R